MNALVVELRRSADLLDRKPYEVYGLNKTCRDAADEIERHLKGYEWCKMTIAERDAEIERLRAALKLIADRTEDVFPPFRVMSIDAMARIARAALEQSAGRDKA